MLFRDIIDIGVICANAVLQRSSPPLSRVVVSSFSHNKKEEDDEEKEKGDDTFGDADDNWEHNSKLDSQRQQQRYRPSGHNDIHMYATDSNLIVETVGTPPPSFGMTQSHTSGYRNDKRNSKNKSKSKSKNKNKSKSKSKSESKSKSKHKRHQKENIKRKERQLWIDTELLLILDK
ncbi:putative ribosomal protein S1, partial [Reticulomyxa filosa]